MHSRCDYRRTLPLKTKPSNFSNPNIRFVDTNNKQNKRQYNVLVYIPSGKCKPYSVVWYSNQWHKCYSEARTYKPYLGPFREEVHAIDILEAKQADKPAKEDSTLEDEREQDTNIHNTLATIEISGPGSTHQED